MMKVGDLIRSRPWREYGHPIQVFDGVSGDWHGTVLLVENPPKTSKYHRIHVLLSSHGGVVGKAWLTKNELKQNIEVIHDGG